MKIEYTSNNSGGNWWLTDKNWLDLEAAGWEVNWVTDDTDHLRHDPDSPDRFLGALATDATRTGLSLRMAIAEWEDITGQSSNALGCGCCGAPHSFTEYDDNGNWIDRYSPVYPKYGDPYDG